MSLDLDDDLADAQDSIDRRPLVEIKSQSQTADIPFGGQYLRSDTTLELNPNAITHSTGRLCMVTIRSGKVRLTYSDTTRSVISYVDIDLPAGMTPTEADLIELQDGNLGIVCYATGVGNQVIYALRVGPTGVVISGPTAIFTYASSSHAISSPSLYLTSGITIMLVYVDLTGGDYYIRKRTTTDFLSWSSEGTCSISGLTATKRIANLCLRKISTGQLWLWFDYLENTSESLELTNIYYSTSSDAGATWSAAVKWTSYDTYNARAFHPVSVQKVANQMYLIFNEIASMLTMRAQVTPGWTGIPSYVQYLQINETAIGGPKLYVSLFKYTIMSPQAVSAMQIDLATWEIDKVWNYDSYPAFPVYWRDAQQYIDRLQAKEQAVHGERNLIPFASTNVDWRVITVLDAEADTITSYYFEDHPLWNPPAVKNVDCSSTCNTINSVWIDYESSRMYILLHKYNYGGACPWSLGYIDLTDEGTVKTYYEITSGTLSWYEFYFQGYYNAIGVMKIEVDANYAILYWGYRTMVIQLSDGTVLKEYSNTTPQYGLPPGVDANPNYPLEGLKSGKYINGKIWGVYRYQIGTYPDYDTEGWDGFCEINIATDEILHHRPPWSPLAGEAHFGFHTYPNIISIDAGARIVVSQYGIGISIYNVAGGTWELFDDENVPGMPINLQFVIYREVTEMLYVGFDPNQTIQLAGFSINGLINRLLYSVGTYSDPSWGWLDPDEFVIGMRDQNVCVTLHPTNKTIYAFWERDSDYIAYRIAWDTESSELDLGPFIDRGKEISVHRSIDGRPSSLDFSVSNGHLFDSSNKSSLLSIYLKKGRKLVLRFGEKISGDDYWQNQGSFLVNETSLKHQRGVYPSMDVLALDRMCFWEYADIFATTYYQNYPKDILISVLENFLGFSSSEIDPALNFEDSELIYQQWLGVKAKELIEQVCHRFFSFPRITVDNKFSARKISNENAVDHIYPDTTKIIEFTPDDAFSDFTNRVTVVGYGRQEIAVTYAEERVGTLNGTCGWWGFKKDFNVNFSMDKSRVCISPRLVVLESSQAIAFQLAGQVHEEISLVDPLNLYCVVTVTAPNLIPMVIAGIALYVVGSYFGDLVYAAGFIANVGWTTPVGRRIEQIGLLIVMMVLSAIGNFQYEVWAKPKGYVKMSMQATANDLVLQQEINAIVTQKLEDPLSYTMEVCQKVADFELMVVKNQRKRIKFNKIAHLQDEEGDTIHVPHPYTEEAIKIFITDIIRRMKIPEKAGGDGYFLDQIEGWNITP